MWPAKLVCLAYPMISYPMISGSRLLCIAHQHPDIERQHSAPSQRARGQISYPVRVLLCDQWNLTSTSFSSLSPEILRVNQMLFLIQTNVPFSGRKIVNGSFFLCALNKQIYHEAPFKMHIDRQIPQQQFIFVHTSFILAWSIWPKLLVMDTWASLSLFKAVPSKYSIIVISRKCASYKGYTEFDCLSLASVTFRDLCPQVANSPL